MKKIFLSTMLVFMFVTTFCFNVNANAIDEEEVKDVVSALNIMSGYETGEFGEYDYLSRSQFAKILVASSKYRNSVPKVNYISPFSDTPFTHWAASYVSVCANAGYLKGLPDGTYMLERNVLYEEALVGTLKLLGYTDSDMIGTYPYNVLALAEDVGLTEDIDLIAGSYVTRMDMAKIIYNALLTKVKGSNSYQVETLGYTVTNGQINSNDIIYTDSYGPIVIKSNDYKIKLNLDWNTVTVYRNGSLSSIEKVELYDVIYYSTAKNTIWAYSNKVVGIYQSAEPNKENPTSVTISGKTYSVLSSAKKLFSYSGFEFGDAITIFFDRDDKIIDAVYTSEVDVSNYGIVTGTGKATFDMDGNSHVGFYADIVSITGTKLRYEVNTEVQRLLGKVVKITFKDDIAYLSSTNENDEIYGRVDLTTMTLGKRKISSNISVLEIGQDSSVSKISIDRYNGMTLGKDNIIYYTENIYGEIDTLVLYYATSESLSSGYIYKDSDGNMCVDIGGKDYSLSSGFDVNTGAALLSLSGNSISGVKSLASYVVRNLTEVNELYVETTDGKRYQLSDDVIVYKIVNSVPLLSNMEEAKNEENTVYAYLDGNASNGGRVRILTIR